MQFKSTGFTLQHTLLLHAQICEEARVSDPENQKQNSWG